VTRAPLRVGLALAGALAAAAAGAQPATPATPPPAPPAEPAVARTALRALLDEQGVLVIEELDLVGRVPLVGPGRVELAAAWAYEPGRESQRLLGVRVDAELPGLERAERTAYLDLHEVDALLRAMAFAEEVLSRPAEAGVTEARFVTLEGFGIAASGGRSTPAFFVVAGRAAPVRVELAPEGFTALRRGLEAARDRLFAR
jgi:hypothetical protein